MSIERKLTQLEKNLILTPIKMYIKKTYNVTVERNDTIGLKPPFLILANHVNNWDPLFINCHVKEPLCFVAAAPLFRNPLLKKVLDYVGAIPKTKSKADTSTIKKIIRAKKSNQAIALFPEGNRTWDGHTEPIVLSTSKLVKMLNIPVVIVKIKGGYLTQPRWSDSIRKGEIRLSFEKLWGVDELKKLTIEEVHEILTNELTFSELAWQEETGLTFKGERMANYLERFLFGCPNCETFGQMHSHEDLFTCKTCGYEVLYNEKGVFEQRSSSFFFDQLKEWNQWQLVELEKLLLDSSRVNERVNLMDDEIKLFVSRDEQAYELLDTYKLSLEENCICFTHLDSKIKKVIPFEDMFGLSVHVHNKIDFFYQNDLYRVEFFHKRTSAYKWYKAITLITKQVEE